MGNTASKSPKSDMDKNRRLRGSSAVGCEKSYQQDIKKAAVNDNYNMKKGKMRLSALLPQQRNYNNKHDDANDSNILYNNNSKHQQQLQQKQPQKKKKTRGKKHSVKSTAMKRNAKYKRVTKSIIGKPSNFQHMGHVGPDQQFTPRTIRHHDDQMLVQQLRDITVHINSLMDDQMTIPISPSTPTSSRMHQQKTEIPSSPSPSPKEEKSHQQNEIKISDPGHNQPSKQQQQNNRGPPPPPPAHWSSLALRQATRRQQQINHQKRLQQLQHQQQQYQQQQQHPQHGQKTQQRIHGTKVSSMKRRNHPVSTKRTMQRSTGRKPRANHVSPNMLGMPPSLRLGPAR